MRFYIFAGAGLLLLGLSHALPLAEDEDRHYEKTRSTRRQTRLGTRATDSAPVRDSPKLRDAGEKARRTDTTERQARARVATASERRSLKKREDARHEGVRHQGGQRASDGAQATLDAGGWTMGGLVRRVGRFFWAGRGAPQQRGREGREVADADGAGDEGEAATTEGGRAAVEGRPRVGRDEERGSRGAERGRQGAERLSEGAERQSEGAERQSEGAERQSEGAERGRQEVEGGRQDIETLARAVASAARQRVEAGRRVAAVRRAEPVVETRDVIDTVRLFRRVFEGLELVLGREGGAGAAQGADARGREAGWRGGSEDAGGRAAASDADEARRLPDVRTALAEAARLNRRRELERVATLADLEEAPPEDGQLEESEDLGVPRWAPSYASRARLHRARAHGGTDADVAESG